MNMPAQRLTRRLQWTLLAYFCLSALFLLVVYLAAPSIYTHILLLMPSLTGRSPAAAALLLMGVGVFLVIVMIGVLRRWSPVFWLPATILQLTGILPALFPPWYSLCRMGASLIAVGIAVWMIQLYRRHGVWAMGRKAPSSAHARDEATPHPKETD
jgi:hypothetical protein